MIPIPSGVRVWIATGHTDMRRGMQGLALTVQESLKRDPHAGDLYIFRGRGAIWPRFFGMMASVCRCTPSAWTAASSSGPRRRMARCRSQRRRWLEKSATDMAAEERGLSQIKYGTMGILGRHKSLNL